MRVEPVSKDMANTIKVDLKEIKEQDKLVVLAENSTASYFIYRGKKMGLEYEILKEFAEHLGVQLEIKMVHNLDNIVDLLNNGEGDMIACNYTVTKERARSINFTNPYMRSSQVVVQRKPKDWRERNRKQAWKEDVITDPLGLIGKKVHVWKNSSYYDRLVNLQNELGDTIYIEAVEGDVLPEQLIEQVADGLIDYTVTDQNVAQINSRFYPNIDIDLNISVKQQIAFGMRKSSKVLLHEFNRWLKDFMKTSTFSYIKHKYLDISQFSSKAQHEFSSLGGGKISKYDKLFKEIAADYNWDWRLLAALVYQESKFKTGQKSWAGAYGLMQFMPGVGPSYGVYPNSSPETQIRGGMKKLYKNYGDWHMITDSIQRIKFTLATYNAGLAHIQDAQRLATKYGKNPNVWDDNVEIIALNLNNPKYYKDELVRSGYLRGSETYNYVREIFTRFNEYESAFEKTVPNS
ncbi:membrane-bound lytic murein transglycosylase F [Lishizhenia tianjinensis]|uniref:Membrane-bound lytic murein transglycosylase F n=1 Tax=Lishizhenia tianjinensis TaxID=477690 RepID=A0A1I6XC32_9FLAO|nr:transporter substrate-binding domain-containing protein [Lishizhenia tianjinensis]SFT35582.1 membrane-bound lytic murein transglycosylase F [Lishizhenia tianjinensis]